MAARSDFTVESDLAATEPLFDVMLRLANVEAFACLWSATADFLNCSSGTETFVAAKGALSIDEILTWAIAWLRVVVSILDSHEELPFEVT